jgi:hypothetical protein
VLSLLGTEIEAFSDIMWSLVFFEKWHKELREKLTNRSFPAGKENVKNPFQF